MYHLQNAQPNQHKVTPSLLAWSLPNSVTPLFRVNLLQVLDTRRRQPFAWQGISQAFVGRSDECSRPLTDKDSRGKRFQIRNIQILIDYYYLGQYLRSHTVGVRCLFTFLPHSLQVGLKQGRKLFKRVPINNWNPIFVPLFLCLLIRN